MTQKIFDTDNKEDMKLLWSILPDDALKICKDVMGCQVWENRKEIGYTLEMIKINWHDKTEITRPVNYEDMIGCVGWFWDDSKADDTSPCLGVLTAIAGGEYYTQVETWGFDNFRPAKKSELKFYGY
jgi:hypothetical protein